jgi:hypothetical protein
MTNRIMVVYERSGDFQATLRIDNGEQKLVTKKGGTADAVRQGRTDVLKTPLEQTLKNLADRGFVRAIVGRHEMRAVETDGVELSLRDIKKFDDPKVLVSTLVEVEALNVEDGHEAAALRLVDGRMKGCWLKPLSDQEFKTWVRETHAAADRPFEYSPEAAAALATSINAFATR